MLYPIFAMVVLTFLVMFWTLYTRVQAVRQGKMSIGYFRLMQGDAPAAVVKASRHFSNLFELPVLFYIVCMLCHIKNAEDSWQIGLAWLYVVCRCLQAIIHLGYNNVKHRLAAFALGNFALLILWLRLIVQL
jgi:hypothetical protein